MILSMKIKTKSRVLPFTICIPAKGPILIHWHGKNQIKIENNWLRVMKRLWEIWPGLSHEHITQLSRINSLNSTSKPIIALIEVLTEPFLQKLCLLNSKLMAEVSLFSFKLRSFGKSSHIFWETALSKTSVKWWPKYTKICQNWLCYLSSNLHTAHRVSSFLFFSWLQTPKVCLWC